MNRDEMNEFLNTASPDWDDAEDRRDFYAAQMFVLVFIIIICLVLWGVSKWLG